jgi:uncharacterized phage-associated protein
MNQISVQELANWFLSKESMTHKKLQKVCYYGVAWGWALMSGSVINDDEFQAWVHGPVAPNLYDKYKQNGWNDIPRATGTANIPGDVADLLEAVWITYGEKSGNELEALSHSEKPWIEARAGLQSNERSNQPISTAVMREYYTSIKSTEY